MEFLSNDSIYFFKLDGKVWPSVTHYIVAKSLPREHEEKVRQASTVLQAKYLARKFPFTQTGFECEEKALKAKFFQNECLLTKLFNLRTIKTGNTLRDAVLNDIRLSSKTKIEDTPDLSSDSLTEADLTIVTNLIVLTKRIVEMEGQDQVYVEIVEDALSNVTRSKSLRKELLTRVKEIVGMSHGQLLKRPKLISFIKRVAERVRLEPGLNEPFVPKMFGAFLYWIKVEAPASDRKSIIKDISDPGSVSIVLPKRKRWYRSIAPPPHVRLLSRPKKVEELPIENETVPEVIDDFSTIEQMSTAVYEPAEEDFDQVIEPPQEEIPQEEIEQEEIEQMQPPQLQTEEEPPPQVSTSHPLLVHRTGTILSFNEASCIALIVNAKTRKMPSSNRLVDTVFTRYPHANVYEKNRYMLDVGKAMPMFDDKEKPVICLVAEYYDKPSKGMIDTAANRKKWFANAMAELSSLTIDTIAFSASQLVPDGYMDIVKEYAEKNNTTVFVVAETPSVSS